MTQAMKISSLSGRGARRGISPMEKVTARRLTRLVVMSALFLGLAVSEMGCTPDMQESAEVYSPDGKLEIEFILAGGVPYYAVIYDGIEVIRRSVMGFTLKSAESSDWGFRIEGIERASFDETWEPVWGQTKEIRNHYNEMTVRLKDETPRLREPDRPGRRINITFRAYDDGLGFRYEWPEQEGPQQVEIMSELTRFNLTGDHTVWWIPADFDTYENLYTMSSLSILLRLEVPAVNTPVTMKTDDGLYVSIHEANLRDFPGMVLTRPEGGKRALKASLCPWPDGTKVKGTLPMRSPWRTIQIARRAGGLIESNLILNLNEPCVLDDTSWIRPMKYIGIWWGMHIGKYTWHVGPKHGATTENAKRYIDFAQAHGIPAVLIEGWNIGWDKWGQRGAYDFVTPYPDFDLEAVVAYARERGVQIIGHHETGGDVPGYEQHIDRAFALYERLGVGAVKTGYAGKIYPRGQYHHGQWMVRHYQMVVEKAARHHLMLDVHEPIKPTGLSRTYPNLMTQEGVRGTEFNAWSAPNPPEHTTVIPFTRMLAGPVDFTPGIFDLTFDEYKPDNRLHCTLANQLALYVVLFSPLQMAADLIENYEGNPAFEFIEDVPVDWDETHVLNGEIGEFITIARRSGEAWFIGSITDGARRTVSIRLDFLDANRKYRARIYADRPDASWLSNPTAIEIREEVVDSLTTLTLRLAAGGGQAIRLIPD